MNEKKGMEWENSSLEYEEWFVHWNEHKVWMGRMIE